MIIYLATTLVLVRIMEIAPVKFQVRCAVKIVVALTIVSTQCLDAYASQIVELIVHVHCQIRPVQTGAPLIVLALKTRAITPG